MVSKVTVFSLLFALMLGVGIERWNVQHQDECAHFLAGEKGYSSTVMVTTGTHQVELPCAIWLPRQPTKIQILCLLDFVVAVVFFLNATADLRRAWEARRGKPA